MVAKDAVAVTTTGNIDVQSSAKVASDTTLTLTSTGADGSIAVKGGAVAYGKTGVTLDSKKDVTITGSGTLVKAGSFTVDDHGNYTSLGGANAALKMTAVGKAEVSGGANVGASGTADVDAGASGVIVRGTGTRLVSNGAMTIDANGGAVEVTDSAYVGGNTTVKVGEGGATASAKVDNAQLVAKEAVAVTTTGNIDVQANAKVASDTTLTLTTTGADGSIAVKGGAAAYGKTGVTLDSAKNVTITGNGTIVKAGSFTVDDHGNFNDLGNGTDDNLLVTAVGKVEVSAGANVGASGTARVTAKGSDGITVKDTGTKLVAEKGIVLNAKKDGEVGEGSVKVSGAYVGTHGTLDITADKNVTVEAATVNENTVASKVESSDNMTITATSGNVTVDGGSRVGTSGNLSITAGGTTGINAAGGVLVADGDGKTTTLTAASGAIDASNDNNDFKSVNATAKDSVKLNDRDDITLTEVKSTDGDVRVRAATGILKVAEAVGPVDSSKAIMAAGDIRLEATAGGIEVGAGVRGGKNVTLIAGGAVTTKKTGAEPGVAASNGKLVAGQDADGNATATGGDLYINAGGPVTLAADHAATRNTADTDGGVMALVSANGSISATGATAAKTLYAEAPNGTVSIHDMVSVKSVSTKSDGDIVANFTDNDDHTVAYKSENGSVTVTANGSITVDTATPSDTDLTVTRVNWPRGTEQGLTEEVTLVNHGAGDSKIEGITAGTSVSLTSNNGGVTAAKGITANNGGVTINANADITVEQTVVVKATGGNATLTADRHIDIAGTVMAQSTTTNDPEPVPMGGIVTLTANGADVTDPAVKSAVEITGTVEGDQKVDVNATATTGSVDVKGGTVVAGTFTNRDTGEVAGGSSANLTVTAGNGVTIQNGAKVGATGNAEVTASGTGGVTVKDSNTKLVADKGMTVKATAEGGNAVIKDGAYVAARNSVSGNSTSITSEKGYVTITDERRPIGDNHTTVGAGSDLTISGKTGVTVDKSSKVASDKILTLNTTDAAGSIVVQGGAGAYGKTGVELKSENSDVKVSGNGTLVKAGSFTVDPETGLISPIAGNDDSAMNATLKVTAGKSVMIDGGANVGASGTATVTAKGADGITVKDSGTKLVADKGMTITASNDESNGNGSVTVFAAYIGTHGTLDITADQNVKVESATVSGNTVASKVESTGNMSIYAKSGDVTVDKSTVGTSGSLLVGKAPAVEGGTPTGIGGTFTVQDDATVRAAGTAAVYATGDIIVSKGAGERTEVWSKGNMTLDATGEVKAGGAVVKAGVIDENTGAVSGAAANLTVMAGKNVTVDGGAKVGASGTATVTANGADADGNTVVVTGDGTKLVSEGNMIFAANGGNMSVDNKAYVGTHGTLGATATGDLFVKDTGTNVESAKAMTLSGANVKVEAARVGTSETLGVTATTGNVEVENKATVIAKNDITVTATGDTTATPVTGGNVTIKDSSVTSTAGSINVGISAAPIGGTFTAQDDATVEATAGNVKVYASGDAKVLDTSRVAAGGGDATVDAGKSISVDGEVVASVNATLTAVDDITISDGIDTTKGLVQAQAGKVEISAGAGGTTASVTVKEDATVSAGTTVGVTAGKDVKILDTADVLAKGTGVTSGDTLKIEAQSGDIVVKSDAGAAATVIAGVVVDENTFSGDNQMTLTAARDVKVQNMGTVAASGNLTATARTGDFLVSNNAKVAAGGDLTGTAGKRVGLSDNAVVASKGAMGLTASSDTFTAEDNAQALAKGTITVNARTTANVDDNAKVRAGEVAGDASDVSIMAGGKISVDGEVQARRNVTLTATGGDVEIFDDTATAGKQYAAFDGDATGVGYDDTTKGQVKAQTGKVEISAGAGETIASVTVKEDATVSAGTTVDVTANGAVDVNDTADITAGTSVTVRSTDTTTASAITIDTTGNVTANDGKVTIGNVDGSVIVRNATVEARGDNGSVDIDATTGVTIEKGSQNATVTAGKDVTVDNSASGNIVIGTDGVTGDGTSVSAAAGKVAVNNAAADVSVLGGAKVTAKTDVDIDAKGSVLMDDSVAVKAETGALAADAADGSVTVADKADFDAGTTLGLTAGTVVKVTENAQVDAGDAIALTAKGGDVTVDGSADVTAGKGATLTASKGVDVLGDAKVTANGGDAVLTAQGEDVKVTGDVKASANATVSANTAVEVSENGTVKATAGDVAVTAKNEVTVTDTAMVEAGTKVDVRSTGAGDVTIDTAKNVTANDGSVTIDNDSGAVTVKNATVEAKGANGSVDIDATTGVTIAKGSQNATVTAGKDVTVDNSASGNIVIGTDGVTGDGTSVSAAAGKVAVNNAAADVSVLGGAKVTAKTDVDIDAKGSVLMDDSVAVKAETGALAADAADGSVTVADKADFDAGTTLGLTAGTVVKVTENAQVDAGDAIALTAKGGDVTVDGSADVTAGKGATLTASKGVDVLGDAKVTANGGDAVLTAQGEDVKVTGDVKASANATVSANTAVEISEDGTVKADSGSVGLTAKNAVTVTGTATVDAGTKVDVKSTGVGDITVDTTKSVTANNGSVTIDNDNGAVTVRNATVEAKGANGSVDIDATTGVTIENGTQNATVTAGKHVLVETSGGDIKVKDATVAAGDNLRLGSAGNVTVDTGVTMTAVGNATIEAKGDVTLNSNVKTTGEKKTVDIEAGNTVAMGNGVTVSTENGNIAIYAAQGDISIASLNAGTGNVWLEAGGTITTKNGTGGTGISAAGAAISAKEIGTKDAPMELNLSTMSLSGTEGVYVENNKNKPGTEVKIVSDTQSVKDGQFNVNHVLPNGDVAQPPKAPGSGSTKNSETSNIDGVVSKGGDVELTNYGDITLVDGAQVSAAGDVVIKAKGDGNIIQQNSTSISSKKGVVGDVGSTTAGVIGQTVTLEAGGTIGSGSRKSSTPLRVEGTVTATANGTAAIANSGGDLSVSSISGTDVNVYAPGSINTGKITASRTLTVTAGNYENGEVIIDAKNLAVNRIDGGHRPQLALFKTQGNKKPNVKNQPNDTIIFIDGRVAGGDIQTINKLGALEAFPVQTPELKSEQGVFGNPFFMHGDMDVSEPVALGIIDFLLVDPSAITYGAEFPLDADTQVEATGLSPEYSYRFLGKKKDAPQKPGASLDNGKSDSEKGKSE